MRIFNALPLLLLTTPAHAWEFTPGLPCLLTHETAEASIMLTYDPTQPLYSVTVTRAEPWPESARFLMEFAGPQGRSIGTDRHVLSANRLSLTVTDKGFGNVLDGLERNAHVFAMVDGAMASFPLAGAAEPVRDFRACELALPTS